MPYISRVETLGSIWILDDDNHRYCRMPKEERPREPGPWPDPTGTNLEDVVWHPMESWRISLIPVPLLGEDGRPHTHPMDLMPLLVIEVDTAINEKVLAPKAGPITRIG